MRTTVTLAIALAFAACSKKGGDDTKSVSSGDKVASCNGASMHSCRQYSAANIDGAGSDSLAKLCTVVDKTAVFAMTACPTANAIGTCAAREGTDVYYQGYVGGDAAALAKDCTGSGGTFTAGK